MEKRERRLISDDDARIEFRKRMRIRGEEAKRIVFETVNNVIEKSEKEPEDEIRE